MGINPNPTISLNTKTTDGVTSGNFTSSISGLIPGKTYYVRAYATNTYGTAYYGNQITFTETIVPLNGLVAFWPFNDNANDISINNNNGIVNGASLTTDRFGKLNSAYNFDGVSNFIQVPNSISLQNINEISISAWVNINQFYYVPNFGYNFPIFTKSNQYYNWGNYELQIWQGGAKIVTHLEYQETECPSNVPLNQWKHIVCTVSNGKTSFYIDGVLILTKNSGVFPQTPKNNMPILIGRNIQGGYPEAAKGKIDDIGIWNRALSLEEVTSLYKSVQ